MVDFERIESAADAFAWHEVLDLVLAAEPSGATEEVRHAIWHARALRFLGRGAEAEAQARRALALATTEPLELKALSELASCVRGSENTAVLERARALADRLGQVSRSAKLRVDLARGRILRGDPAGAQRLLDEAVAIRPEVEAIASYCQARAKVASRLGQPGATAWLERGLDVESPIERAAVLCDLGTLHRARGEDAEAIRCVRQGLEEIGKVGGRTHTEAQLLNILGDCLRATGDLDGAEGCYLRAADLMAARQSPDEPVTRCNLALVRLERGDVAGAQAELAALEQVPNAVSVLEVAVALGLGACGAMAGDRALFHRAYAAWTGGVPLGTPLDADFVLLAERAARAAARAGWGDEAVHASRVALELARRLEHAERARSQCRRLRRLADDGAQAPLGPFFLVRPLASGSFGEVWLARHHTGTRVAIKLLTGDLDRAQAQLDNELRHVAALDHPHIVRLLDYGVVDRAAAVMRPGLVEGSRWIAVELAPDGTLSDKLGQVPFTEVRRILLSLLDALAHAHARGVLHLDIKPANVLASGERVLLADFGLARRPGPEGYLPSGTPQYMAPEQFAHGGQDLGPWTDLYGVGCLAVALVSGAPPFGTRGSTAAALRAAHRTERPEVAPVIEVPRGFLAWVQRMLAKDPTHRFRHAADAARSLLSLAWVQESEVAPGSLPAEAFSTVVLPAADELGPVPALPPEGAIEVPEPTVPLRWRRPEAFVRDDLADAGIRLFALRRPVLVGRDRERSLLWGALRACHDEGRPRAVVLDGPEGVGRTALGQWLVERAGELGVRVPVVWLDEVGVQVVEQDEPVLLVATTHGEHPLLDHERTVPIAIGPLPEPDVRRMLASLLAVAPQLADAIVAHARGLPAYVRQVLADLVLRRGLVRTPEGWALGRELALPPTLEELWRQRLASVLAGIPPARRTASDPSVRSRLLDAGFSEAWIASHLSATPPG